MKTIRIGLLLCLGAAIAFAQFGGLLKKATGSKSGADPAKLLAQGQDLIGYVTIATDEGVRAVSAMASVFPPEKVQKVADLAAKYNEMKSKRSDQNIDAESIQVAKEIATEMAGLDSQWQAYVKEKSAAVKKADARLALVVFADGLAATKAPETAKAIQSAVQDLANDPTQVSKIQRLSAMASLLTAVARQTPQQVTSFKTVRGIAKRIADAEKIQLDPDPSAEKVKDRSSFESAVKPIT